MKYEVWQLKTSSGQSHVQRAKGMRLEPPQPFYGSWDTSSRPYRKKNL